MSLNSESIGPRSSSINRRYPFPALTDPSTHIRLLEWCPPTTDGVLRFLIDEHELSSELTYNALSYEWGAHQTASQKTIIVNDCPFEIYENLHAFLTRLMQFQQHRDFGIFPPFFADAICINQADLNERNSQVKSMAGIYQRANCVLVWLGEANNNSDMVFDVVNATENLMMGCEVASTRPTGEYMPQIIQPDFVTGVVDIYRRTYWSRLWIIQELYFANSKVFFCGSKFMEQQKMELLSEMMLTLRHDSSVVTATTGESEHWKHVLKLITQLDPRFMATPLSICDAVLGFGYAKCQETHDKIYGLLGIAKNTAICIDYSTSPLSLLCDLINDEPYLYIHLTRDRQLFQTLHLEYEPDAYLSKENIIVKLPASIRRIRRQHQWVRLGILDEAMGLQQFLPQEVVGKPVEQRVSSDSTNSADIHQADPAAAETTSISTSPRQQEMSDSAIFDASEASVTGPDETDEAGESHLNLDEGDATDSAPVHTDEDKACFLIFFDDDEDPDCATSKFKRAQNFDANGFSPYGCIASATAEAGDVVFWAKDTRLLLIVDPNSLCADDRFLNSRPWVPGPITGSTIATVSLFGDHDEPIYTRGVLVPVLLDDRQDFALACQDLDWWKSSSIEHPFIKLFGDTFMIWGDLDMPDLISLLAHGMRMPSNVSQYSPRDRQKTAVMLNRNV